MSADRPKGSVIIVLFKILYPFFIHDKIIKSKVKDFLVQTLMNAIEQRRKCYEQKCYAVVRAE